MSVAALNNGVPVAGLSVSFIDGKKGTFSPNPAITNSSGIASTSFTLPATAGTVTVTAGRVGYTSASFTETVTAPVETLAVNGGNNQSGNVSTALPTPLTVLATTEWHSNRWRQRCLYRWRRRNVQSQSAVSNSSGIASTSYTLPATAGTYTVTGSSSGYSSATFTETATSSVAVTQLGLFSGGKQTGTVGTSSAAADCHSSQGCGRRAGGGSSYQLHRRRGRKVLPESGDYEFDRSGQHNLYLADRRAKPGCHSVRSGA